MSDRPLLPHLLSPQIMPIGGALLSTTANSFRVSLSTQRVLVWGPSLPSFETVTGVIAKTGKEIRGKKIVEDLALLPELDPQ